MHHWRKSTLGTALGLAALVFSSLAGVLPAGAHPAGPSVIVDSRPLGSAADWHAGRVIVKLRDGASLNQAGGGLATLLARHKLTAGEQAGNVFALQGAGDLDVAATVAALRADPAVAYAEPDYLVTADLTPNDEKYADIEWWLSAMQTQAAWDISTGNPDLILAVLDTGVAGDHPEFEGRMLGGYNFVSNNTDAYDDNGHGTHVAGIASAAGNNGGGIAGISWQHKILPVKVLNDKGQGSTYDFAQGIRWATDAGARVINISAGADFSTETEHDAIKYAKSKGVVIVTAAGNTPDGKPRYPAGYDEVIAVSASSQRDSVAGFSSFGDYVDVAAPGINILSTFVVNRRLGYESQSGTSMACPMVAGAVALILSVNPGLSADQVQLLLQQTSNDIGDPGFDQKSGWGRINILRALQEAPAGPKPGNILPSPGGNPAENGSKIQGNVSGVSNAPEMVEVLLLPQNGTVPQTIRPDADGLFVFNGLTAGKYMVQLALKTGGYTFPAPQQIEVTGRRDNVAQVNFSLAARRPAAFDPAPEVPNSAELIYFPPVRHSLRGPFLRYWQQKGGLPIFGYPISEEFQEVSPTDGKTYTVQYFQRNRFEYHPEFAGSGNEVLLGLLGVEMTKGRLFAPGQQGPNDPTHRWFPPVQHNLQGAFLAYWERNGGLAVFGYPISEEFQEVNPTDGKTYTVQYFQRNRFELHPEFAGTTNEVLLGLLGVDIVKAKGWLQ